MYINRIEGTEKYDASPFTIKKLEDFQPDTPILARESYYRHKMILAIDSVLPRDSFTRNRLAALVPDIFESDEEFDHFAAGEETTEAVRLMTEILTEWKTHLMGLITKAEGQGEQDRDYHFKKVFRRELDWLCEAHGIALTADQERTKAISCCLEWNNCRSEVSVTDYFEEGYMNGSLLVLKMSPVFLVMEAGLNAAERMERAQKATDDRLELGRKCQYLMTLGKGMNRLELTMLVVELQKGTNYTFQEAVDKLYAIAFTVDNCMSEYNQSK